MRVAPAFAEAKITVTKRASERDLADMGMTRIDAFNEIQKPFWQT